MTNVERLRMIHRYDQTLARIKAVPLQAMEMVEQVLPDGAILYTPTRSCFTILKFAGLTVSLVSVGVTRAGARLGTLAQWRTRARRAMGESSV